MTSELEVLGLCPERNQVYQCQIIDRVKARQLSTLTTHDLFQVATFELSKAFKIHWALVSPNVYRGKITWHSRTRTFIFRRV